MQMDRSNRWLRPTLERVPIEVPRWAIPRSHGSTSSPPDSRALTLYPSFAPAAVNLADLYRALGREAEGDAVLRKALQRNPDDAVLLHSLGLSLVRQKQNEKALR